MELEKTGGSTIVGPIDVGTGVKTGEKTPLSKIIEILDLKIW